ncbi:MAG: class I SAM-dependent methyltransferase [Asticcacaulis sp.]|uniref:class I SAM-dependent methyltransferase n=1 Tax=Asticcacaulis sp. TaxID=1872648 RepID=UPI003F7CA03C
MPEPVQHVSDTAFWVAWHRAQEGKRRDALFHDPLAEKLAGERGRNIASHMGIPRAMAWSMALRTHIIDRLIRDAVKDGADMILNLGAGLDTRPYRLELPPELQWVEVDFAPMIAYKEEALADEKPVCRLKRLVCDLGDDAARRETLAALRAKRILVLTEGVVPYLSNDQVAGLAHDLAAQPHIMAWLSDYYAPLFHTLSARGKVMRRLAENAPFRFDPGSSRDDWPRFFAACGWQIDEMIYLGEEGRRLGRDLPVNPLMRLMMRFAPEERLRPYRRMNGFVRFTRGDHVQSI